MVLRNTFSHKEQLRFNKAWNNYFPQLRTTFEPAYHVSPHYITAGPRSQPFTLTSWVNGRATILPPADLVSLIIFDPERQALRTYLIEQPILFEQLGPVIKSESLPTRFFVIDELPHNRRGGVLSQAAFINESKLSLSPSPHSPPHGPYSLN